MPLVAIRGYSSVGRALEWHSRGQGFESPYLHQRITRYIPLNDKSPPNKRVLCFRYYDTHQHKPAQIELTPYKKPYKADSTGKSSTIRQLNEVSTILTELQVKGAKPKAKPYMVRDDRGLYETR